MKAEPLALLMAALFLCGCSGGTELKPENTAAFINASGPDKNDTAGLALLYRKKILPALKKQCPLLLEKAAFYSPGPGFRASEARGLLQAALLSKAQGMEKGSEAAAILAPALPEFLTLDTSLLSGLDSLQGGEAVENGVNRLTARLASLSLGQMEIQRSRSEATAQRHLEVLRALVLALPEEKSQVANATAMLREKLNRNPNDIRIEEILDLMKGAYPGLF